MAKGKYDWGKGGKVHSIPKATHQQNEQAKRALGSLDLTAPPTGAQAVREANSAADLQYGPQVNQARQANANVAPWFSDFQAKVAGYAIAARQQAAPVLAQAAQYQQGAGAQTAPGLDPNSAAGQQAAQAAQGRGALAQLGNDALNTNAQATQDYFGGQQAVAARQMPQVQMAAGQNLANAESQRGAAVQGFLTTARQNAQNYAIARGTLNLNGEKAAATATNDANAITQSAADKRAQRAVTKRGQDISQQNTQTRTQAAGEQINKYNVPENQWKHWSAPHRQRVIDAFNEKGASGASDKAAAKHATDVHAATGKVENTVSDIINTWDTYAKTGTADDPKKPITKNGQPVKDASGHPTYEQRKLTPDEVRGAVGQKNKAWTPQLVHIALLRRAKPPKPLDQASIDYLHNLDPNFRIPRDWLPYDPSIKAGSKNDPKGGAGANK